MLDYISFNLGDVLLQSGITLRNAHIAYKTYGTLNSNRDNCIIFPTFFGSQHDGNEPMIGSGMALDPDKYFIVIPNLLGNGLSSSPSNNPPPFDRARFPSINYYDNIQCQHRLLTEEFQVNKIALACGFSMGSFISESSRTYSPLVRFSKNFQPQSCLLGRRKSGADNGPNLAERLVPTTTHCWPAGNGQSLRWMGTLSIVLP